MKFKFSSRFFVNAIWCAAFGTALFVLLSHRPESLTPKLSLESGPNEYLSETQPLREMFLQLERDLAKGTISLDHAISMAESFMENSLQKESLRDFVGASQQERISHMLLLWLERRREREMDSPTRERLHQLGTEHARLFPGSDPYPPNHR